MGYVLLWCEVLAAAMLVAALLVVRSARNWTNGRLHVCRSLVATLLPTGFICCTAGIAWYVERGLHARVIALGPILVMAPLLLFGTIALWYRGLSRDGGLKAAAWPVKWLIAAILVTVAMQVGTFAYLDDEVRRQLTELRGEVDAMANSVAPPQVADGDNAALVYAQAFDLLPRESHDWPEAYHEWYSSKVNADDPTAISFPVEDCREFLQEHRRAVELLRIAAAKPGCHFGIPYLQRGYFALLTEFDGVRDGAKLLELSARSYVAEGRFTEALADVAAIYAMAEHLTAEPILVAHLNAIATQGIAVETLEAILTGTELSQDPLSAVPPDPGFSARPHRDRCMTMEEAVGLSIFCKLADHHGAIEWIESLGDSPKTYAIERFVPTGAFYRVLLVSGDLAAYRGAYEQYRQAGSQPIHEVQATLDRIESQLEDEPNGLVTFLAMPTFAAVFQSTAWSDAVRATGQIGLAMHRYRAAHGEFPASLDELVPEALDAVARDPFDGQPIRLVTTDDGWIVYNIGPDMTDEGGEPFNSSERTGDLVFRYRCPGASEAAESPGGDTAEGDDR